MLQILEYGNGNNFGYHQVWHVSEPLPRYSEPIMVRHVDEIQADGAELEYILERFDNIKDTRVTVISGKTISVPEVQKWYGDDARFIVGNLV